MRVIKLQSNDNVSGKRFARNEIAIFFSRVSTGSFDEELPVSGPRFSRAIENASNGRREAIFSFSLSPSPVPTFSPPSSLSLSLARSLDFAVVLSASTACR